ncbi:hypothetical protein J4E91_010470 [Alternaria rosae]|nr:hypothetical protein J4E91_010470 [Alternaria rosae]
MSNLTTLSFLLLQFFILTHLNVYNHQYPLNTSNNTKSIPKSDSIIPDVARTVFAQYAAAGTADAASFNDGAPKPSSTVKRNTKRINATPNKVKKLSSAPNTLNVAVITWTTEAGLLKPFLGLTEPEKSKVTSGLGTSPLAAAKIVYLVHHSSCVGEWELVRCA